MKSMPPIYVPGPLSPQQGTRHAISAVYDNSLGSQEAIVERAKQVSGT